jgi:aspartate ammonia-lyase
MRKEADFLGTVEIPEDALYGIHSVRAARNFPDTTLFHMEWYRATGMVKKACFQTYRNYAAAVQQKYPGINPPQPLIDEGIVDALYSAAAEVESGRYFDHFIVPAVQGGAGTSINMNVNEIIANRALLLTGHRPGEYRYIDPIEHANVFQSTNDVIPTSLKVALLGLLRQAETAVNDLRAATEDLEKASRDHMRIAYTQMQEAVPSSFGRLFSTYNDALSRDWWRISKCSERIKTINLGGSAVGTAITVPRYFVREAAKNLRQSTGLPVARAENLHDATCNLDSFVEIHGILKAHAVNLEKMVSDLRLLSSDLVKNREMEIPRQQVGSSVMPGKVNPVIPEFVISSAHQIYSNDQLVTSLCGLGCLDLNAYLPVIGHALIGSIRLLIACNNTLNINLLKGLQLHPATSMENLLKSPAIATALLPFIGYNKAARLAGEMKNRNINLLEANQLLRILDENKLLEIIQPHNLLAEGFTLNETMDENGKGQGA